MTFQTVNAEIANTWLKSGEAVLIDVRENEEYNAEHIAEAIHIPLATLPDHYVEIQTRAEGKKLIFQCHLGGRSGRACKQMAAIQPNLSLWNLEGGIEAWKNAGLPISQGGPASDTPVKNFCQTKKTKSSCPSMERQVQIAAGALVTLTVFMGYKIHPIWFSLSGIIGVGLMLAGLTGHCGMKKLLMKMPWNKS